LEFSIQAVGSIERVVTLARRVSEEVSASFFAGTTRFLVVELEPRYIVHRDLLRGWPGILPNAEFARTPPLRHQIGRGA
jgi:hypothetical protein